MYHDQVLIPMKTLFNFNALNITIGLPFIEFHLITDLTIQCWVQINQILRLFYAMKFIDSLK